MKMKLQKSYFKKVILLLMLLTGSIDFSFSVVTAAALGEDLELVNDTEFTEQHQDVCEGSRPVLGSLQPFRLNSVSALPPYQFLSITETQKTAAYIRFCRHIEPSLGITEIIYPFHFFL